eukprot:1683238-Pyramimonas_sp.AAC.3
MEDGYPPTSGGYSKQQEQYADDYPRAQSQSRGDFSPREPPSYRARQGPPRSAAYEDATAYDQEYDEVPGREPVQDGRFRGGSSPRNN